MQIQLEAGNKSVVLSRFLIIFICYRNHVPVLSVKKIGPKSKIPIRKIVNQVRTNFRCLYLPFYHCTLLLKKIRDVIHVYYIEILALSLHSIWIWLWKVFIMLM